MLKSNEENLLKQQIQQAKFQGYSNKEIKASLMGANYPERIIDKYLGYKSKKPLIIVSITIAVIIIIALIFFIPQSTPENCITQACFIEAANSCKSATYQSTYETAEILYITKSCTLTKKVIAMDPSEPTEIKDLFVNAEMTCQYTKNNFNTKWLTTLTQDLDTCQGPLKAAIQSIL